MPRTKPIPYRIKRAFLRKKHLDKRAEVARVALDKLEIKHKSPKSMFTALTGIKPKRRVSKIHTGKGSIIFVLDKEDFRKVVRKEANGEKLWRWKGVDAFAPSPHVIEVSGLRGKVAFIDRRRKARDLVHEISHVRSPANETYHFKDVRNIGLAKMAMRIELMSELNAIVYEHEILKKDKISGALDVYISDLRRELNDTKMSKRNKKQALAEINKEAGVRVDLVQACLDKGVPQNVLSDLISTSNWRDLPTSLRKMFLNRADAVSIKKKK
jgi:hypothetical protein